MSITMKFYPQKNIRLQSVRSRLIKDINAKIIQESPLWITGKILGHSDEIGFLFTDEGSFAFTLDKYNADYIKCIIELLNGYGCKCFVGIVFKLYFEDYLDKKETVEYLNSYTNYLENDFDILCYKFGMDDKNREKISYIEMELKQKNDCAYDIGDI